MVISVPIHVPFSSFHASYFNGHLFCLFIFYFIFHLHFGGFFSNPHDLAGLSNHSIHPFIHDFSRHPIQFWNANKFEQICQNYTHLSHLFVRTPSGIRAREEEGHPDKLAPPSFPHWHIGILLLHLPHFLPSFQPFGFSKWPLWRKRGREGKGREDAGNVGNSPSRMDDAE
jgi:hypothetical protein